MMLNKLPDNGNIINRLHAVPSNLNKMLSERKKYQAESPVEQILIRIERPCLISSWNLLNWPMQTVNL